MLKMKMILFRRQLCGIMKIAIMQHTWIEKKQITKRGNG